MPLFTTFVVRFWESESNNPLHAFMDSLVFTTEQRDKIINTLIFLGEKIKPLHVTKALKFIYLLDEQAVARFGIPFFGLEYLVWQYGPVDKHLYSELRNPSELAPFVEVRKEQTGKGLVLYLKKNTFDDSEFSQAELDLLAEIRERYWTMMGKEMVHRTHREEDLWYKTASRYNLLDSEGNMTQKTSTYLIDFTELIENEKVKLERYKSFQEFRAI